MSLVPHTPRVARAAIPWGAYADSITESLEGRKIRMKDGRLSFTDSQFNLDIIRNTWPDVVIELPLPVYIATKLEDLKVGNGIYQTAASNPLYRHQNDALDKGGDAEFFAYFMEPGTGKTRTAIDKVGRHFARGEITGVIIITFNGIHTQWVAQQIPEHMGSIQGRLINYEAHAWNKKPVPWAHPPSDYRNGRARLEFFCVTFSSLSTKKGAEEIERFMARHPGRIMTIIDESHGIKTYDTIRTEECIAIGRRSRIRLIMSGTPIPAKLEDEWSQSVFLSESIFGYRYVSSFRARYSDTDGNPRYIDEFRAKMAPYSFRVMKEEALDLPPKIMTQFVYDMSAKTRKAYDELKKNFLTEIAAYKEARDSVNWTAVEEGTEEIPEILTVTVQNAAVLLLRLQQIVCGTLVNEDKTVIELGDERLEALSECLEQFPQEKKIIIWCRFRRDIVKVEELLTKLYGKECIAKLVREQKDAERDAAVHRFMNDDTCRFFLSSPALGGTGRNLQGECATVIYYSNSFDSVLRWQSEDRSHRIGTFKPVTYVDITARKSVDEGLRKNLSGKKSFADLVLNTVVEA